MTNINSLATTQEIGWSDLRMVRDAANVAALRNSTNSQTLNVYNTYTNASNYRRASINAASDGNLYITEAGAGTGAGAGSIYVGAGWYFSNLGHLLGQADATSDFGDATHRARDVYVGRDLISAGGTQAVLRTSSAITTGAGVGAGTLTNAPAAGNPTKWVPINDNGTTRYVPAW